MSTPKVSATCSLVIPPRVSDPKSRSLICRHAGSARGGSFRSSLEENACGSSDLNRDVGYTDGRGRLDEENLVPLSNGRGSSDRGG